MKNRDIKRRLDRILKMILESNVEPLGGDPVEGHRKLHAWVDIVGDRNYEPGGEIPNPNSDPDVIAFREWFKQQPPPSAQAIQRARQRHREKLMRASEEDLSWLD